MKRFRTLSTVLLLVCACGRGPVAEAPAPADTKDLAPALVIEIGGARERVRSSGGDARAWGELGMLYEANNLGELALPCYAEAARADGSELRWPFRTAVTLSKLGRISDAVSAIRASIDRKGMPPTAHWRLGLWLLDLGKVDEALAEFLLATRFAPRDASGWIGLGRARLQRDEASPAIEALTKALELRPDDGYVKVLLVSACRMAGRDEEAAAYSAAGPACKPVWTDPWEAEVERFMRGHSTGLIHARQLLDSGNASAAITEFEALRAQFPDDVAVLQGLGVAYDAAGSYARARETLEAAVRVEPDSASNHLYLGIAHSHGGKLPEALAELDRAIALDPRGGEAHEVKASLLRQAGRLAEAVQEFRAELALDQTNPHVRRWLAESLLDLGRNAEALAEFEAATRYERPTADNRVAVAFAKMRLGDLAGAEIALQQAETLRGANPAALRAARQELEMRRSAPRKRAQ